MRIDRNDGQEYADFWDWINRSWHLVFVLNVALGYPYYLFATEEA